MSTMSPSRMIALAAGGDAKVPRTERGRRTLRKLLDAAAEEFGEKGFHESSVVSITQRAGVALGSFYTYFDSKDALFRALVADMSEKVRTSARSALTMLSLYGGHVGSQRAVSCNCYEHQHL